MSFRKTLFPCGRLKTLPRNMKYAPAIPNSFNILCKNRVFFVKPIFYLSKMNLSALEKYLPKDALPFINSWIDKNPIQIKILPSRKTKLGDYRFLKDLNRHQITIDAYLKPEAFFFVLTHEIAHLLVYNKFKNKVSP